MKNKQYQSLRSKQLPRQKKTATNWKYDSIYNPYNYEGFIYMIENKLTNQFYIGKKNFWTDKAHTKPTDWAYYKSSSKELINDIKQYGQENFNFLILKLCSSNLNYYEAKYLFNYDVLESKSSYNANILGKFFKSKINKM